MVKMTLVEVTELVYHQIQKVLVDTLVNQVLKVEDLVVELVVILEVLVQVVVHQEVKVVDNQVVVLQVVPQHLETLVEVEEGVSQTVHH